MEARDAENDRYIALPGTLNLRDVGGYPVADGGTVRWRTLLRSDALNRLDDAGRAVLADLGLRTVIDLRTDSEVEAAPSALDGTAAQTVRVPLFSAEAIGRLPPDLPAVYRYMIDNCGAAIAKAIGRLAVPGALPGLVHCTAGKDRTGLVTALVLEVIGVPDDVIAADYALSHSSSLAPDTAKQIGRIQSISGVGRWLDLGALGSPPKVIHTALAHIRAQSGTVANYLFRHGLTTPDLATLRAALTT